MIEFLCLGSGSSGNCYYLKTEKCSILIDAGIPVRTIKKAMWNYGFSLEEVKAIFITHDHADHIKSVGCLANDWHKPIYATERVHIGINNNYCTTQKVTEESRRYLYKDEATQIGDLTITPFEVSHDSSECVGYRIQQGELTFCLATDVGEVTPSVAEAIGMANYLVLEANHDEEMLAQGPYPAYLKARIRSGKGHLSNRQCADALVTYASPQLQHVWLCHLSEENNHPELARKTIETVLRGFGIVAGTDFKMDILNRLTPTGVFVLN